MIYMLVAIILLSETIAISFLKEYSVVHQRMYAVLGMLCYTIVSFLLVRSFHYEGMGMVNVLWSAFSVLFVESVGVFKFHERITHTQVIGIACALTGIAIVRF